MRIVVTGGAGFIGGHLVRALAHEGHEVVVIDDLSRGRAEAVPAGVALHEVDVRDADAIDRIFGDVRPDAVSHQAAQTSVVASFRDPVHDADVNVRGGLHVLRACIRHGVARFVHASSGGAIYGEVAEGRIAGRGDPPTPATPYGWSKLAFEGYCDVIAPRHGISTHALRYANVYGPAQDAEGEAGVVATFCRAAVTNTAVKINARRELGDDGCIRDYVHVADVVAINRRALFGELSDRVLDVATGIGTTTRALARAIAAAHGHPLSMQDAPVRDGDVERSVIDGAPLRTHLGHVRSLAEGLMDTVAWFREHA